jgi:hypothetical protein
MLRSCVLLLTISFLLPVNPGLGAAPESASICDQIKALNDQIATIREERFRVVNQITGQQTALNVMNQAIALLTTLGQTALVAKLEEARGPISAMIVTLEQRRDELRDAQEVLEIRLAELLKANPALKCEDDTTVVGPTLSNSETFSEPAREISEPTATPEAGDL